MTRNDMLNNNVNVTLIILRKNARAETTAALKLSFPINDCHSRFVIDLVYIGATYPVEVELLV